MAADAILILTRDECECELRVVGASWAIIFLLRPGHFEGQVGVAGFSVNAYPEGKNKY
jgi:hypothetical protein